MQLLFDECTPKRLTNYFPGHHIQTVTEAGLNGSKNGQLLRAAVEMGFDVLVTVDQRLRFQQNLSQFTCRHNPRSKAVSATEDTRAESAQGAGDDPARRLRRGAEALDCDLIK
jgi:hypothetical protein